MLGPLMVLASLAVNGFAVGATYALFAAGLALLLAATHIYDLGFAGSLTAGAYAALAFQQVMHAPWFLSIPAAMVVAGLVSGAGYVFLYSPLTRRSAPPFVVIGTSIGYLIVLTNLLQIIFGPNALTITGSSLSQGSITVGEFFIRRIYLIGIAATVICLALLQLILNRTRLGREMRAVSSEPGLAESLGIDVPRTHLLAFVLSGAMAAPAAVLLGMETGVTPGFGLQPLLLASLAVIVAGIGSRPLLAAAAAAGLGIVESVGVWQFPTEWQTTIGFVAAIIVLLALPRGLAGRHLWRAET